MKITTLSRIVVDNTFRRGFRDSYWAAQKNRERVVRLYRNGDRTLARHVASDFASFLRDKVTPIPDHTRVRAKAAVAWICRAQDATPDHGVSLGYFPCDEEQGWWPSYPETTGYIIPSLLEFARRYDDPAIKARALRMASWEAEIQMPSGAVQGGPVCSREKQTPCAFNTGMVLDGWSAAYKETGDRSFLEAGCRAADYLVGDLTADGYFRTNGNFVTPGLIKTYNALCAWPLYRFGQQSGNEAYQHAAVRVIEAALRQQRPNGWFANNCLTRPDAPLLHTIGYTLQGVLEVGLLANRPDFIAAATRGVDALVQRMTANGFLPGRFYSHWEPASLWSCLTGSAQLAVVCYRLGEHLNSRAYVVAGDRITNYLKFLQALDSSHADINGALAGSFPFLGGYMTGAYPNWATKYLLDALLLQERLGEN